MDLLAIFHLEEHVKTWMQAGRYGALFLLLFSCGLGVPLPEDLPIITAGVMIAHHHMNLALAAPLAWAGIIAGDCMLYALGWRFGYNVTKLPLIGRHITLTRIQRAEVLFERFGILVVGIGRMFAGVRGGMVIAAGTTRYRFIKFIIADGLGAIVSGGFFMYIGYWFGANTAHFKDELHAFRIRFLICGAVVGVVATIFIWWRMTRPTPLTPAAVEAFKDVKSPASKPA
jgi:membrane-associated protein